MSASFAMAGTTLQMYFDNAENSSNVAANAFSTSGADNAPMPHYNGRMIINVVASQSSLRDALRELSASDSSK